MFARRLRCVRFKSVCVCVYVCHHAGIVKAAPFLEMSEKDFDDVIAVNLKGV